MALVTIDPDAFPEAHAADEEDEATCQLLAVMHEEDGGRGIAAIRSSYLPAGRSNEVDS